MLLPGLWGMVGCGFDPTFHRPNVIAAAPDGSFLVLNDSQAKRLLVLDRNFRLIREITHPNLYNAWGVGVTDREIIVLNNRSTGVGQNRAEREAFTVYEVLYFDHQGNLRRARSWEGARSPLKAAGGFHRDVDGSLVIADYRQNCLVRVDPHGEFAGTIATYGTEPGYLWYPNDVCGTLDGGLLVADQYNSRLQLFDGDGTFRQVVSARGDDPGFMNFPQYVTRDRDGNVYVTELGTMRVSMFDHTFSFVRTMSPPRRDEAELFQLFGLCVLEDPRRVVVVDSLNNRLYVFDGQGAFLETVDRVR
ncbi:MAG: hypothetical protein OZSIB_1432 [Candidatus Ozemobacter sibiricus]|jgi:sugar lactone lactonase YvrE|uniref:NHL repeat domain protein n=1 Tax=Candidatus Ozemobacter sibiricus TaxID=2268124 RepID=A0A367ZM86_9BACT|nr:MAG: hypothetical protein OZSIB_1432 [Candidatus Ozemobacter sibiricus]